MGLPSNRASKTTETRILYGGKLRLWLALKIGFYICNLSKFVNKLLLWKVKYMKEGI
jgi:hypothetical protein